MARLSKNQRIRNHKLFYGRTFNVESTSEFSEIKTNVKVTKHVKKGNHDRLHITCSGTYFIVDGMGTRTESFRYFAHCTWRDFGPEWVIKSPLDRSYYHHVPVPMKQIIKELETILLEVTVLENNEQKV